MKISREFKTAIIVLGGILLFILGYTYLKSNPVFSTYRTYYAVYDNVGGLAPATPVTINGFPVGKVLEIQFLGQKGKLLVSFSVENDFTFSKNSKAQIYDTGIIGGKSIEIIPVFDASGMSVSGDTLPSSIKPGLTELVTENLSPLQKKFEGVISNADAVLLKINEVLDDKTRSHVKQSINDLSATVANFRKSSGMLNDFLTKNKQKLNNSTENINNITKKLSDVSDQLAEADYAKTMKAFQMAIENINEIVSKIESGQGTIGKLFSDQKMYENLTETSEQLGLLLEDMRLNPKRYVHFSVFGKRQKPYTPPTEEKNPEDKEAENK